MTSELVTPQQAAVVLMKYGHYEGEGPNTGAEWLLRESVDVAAAFNADQPVYDVLVDTAYVDKSDPESVACGRAVEAEMAAQFGSHGPVEK